MANNRISIRRTSTSGKVPTTSDINTGELGLNLTDGILYSTNGSVVFEVGANNTNVNITGNAAIKAIVANGSIGGGGQILASNGSGIYWTSAGGGGVFTGSVYPTGNTLLLGNSTSRWVVSANTIDASGLITGSGGATITGTTNTSVAFNVGTSFIANTTGVYHTGTVNAARYTVGSNFVANSTTVYTTGSVLSYTTTEWPIKVRLAGTTATTRSTVLMQRANNTLASPTAVTSGMYLGGISMGGYDGSNWSAGWNGGAEILAIASEAWSNTAKGTAIYFNTTAAGSNSPSTVAYLAPNGNLGIGNTTPAHKLRVEGVASVTANLSIESTGELVIAAGAGIYANGSLGSANQVLYSNGSSVYWASAGGGGVTLTANNTDSATYYFPMSNSYTGSWSNGVVANADLYFVPATGTLSAIIFNSLSDENYKTNIHSINDALSIVSSLRGVSFNWKQDDRPSMGVIAQEIESILPELVSTHHNKKSVNYDGLIGVLIEAIKELKQEIENLKNHY